MEENHEVINNTCNHEFKEMKQEIGIILFKHYQCKICKEFKVIKESK